jgi:hypothetical protein
VFLLELGQDCELAHQAVLQLLEPPGLRELIPLAREKLLA